MKDIHEIVESIENEELRKIIKKILSNISNLERFKALGKFYNDESSLYFKFDQ